MKTTIIVTVDILGVQDAVMLQVEVPRGMTVDDVIKKATTKYNALEEAQTVDEHCPYCEQDVVLKVREKYTHVQCPKCKLPIRPCSICSDEEYNSKCSSCNMEGIFKGTTWEGKVVEGYWVDRNRERPVQWIKCYKTKVKYRVSNASLEMLNMIGKYVKFNM